MKFSRSHRYDKNLGHNNNLQNTHLTWSFQAPSRRCPATITPLLTLALTCALLLPPAAGRPAQSGLGLEKRVSDQRLAELETLLAMAVNNRRMAEMPVGFGLIDPHAIGRRKRSTHPLSDALLQELARNPTAYNNLLQVLSSYVQQEDQQEALQMSKLVGGSGEFGGANGVRGSIIYLSPPLQLSFSTTAAIFPTNTATFLHHCSYLSPPLQLSFLALLLSSTALQLHFQYYRHLFQWSCYSPSIRTILPSTLATIHSTLATIHSTLATLHSTLATIHSTLATYPSQHSSYPSLHSSYPSQHFSN
ncbi:hypothetical protein FHG87_001227 [Trinorchestia longiramus]|nr:hypothetical protein FHG87_001227 [Trinorchestia longiramus]